MNFEDLQNTWRKEMTKSDTLEKFSIEKIARDAARIGRETRFGGAVFAAMAIAITLIMYFVGYGRFSTMSLARWLELLFIPLIFGYISWMYFKAANNGIEYQWTLAARLKSEKEKLRRQIGLYRKLPTHFLLPVLVYCLLVMIYGGINTSQAEFVLTARLVLSLAAVGALLMVTWIGLKLEIRYKLMPVLEKLEQLERELLSDGNGESA